MRTRESSRPRAWTFSLKDGASVRRLDRRAAICCWLWPATLDSVPPARVRHVARLGRRRLWSAAESGSGAAVARGSPPISGLRNAGLACQSSPVPRDAIAARAALGAPPARKGHCQERSPVRQASERHSMASQVPRAAGSRGQARIFRSQPPRAAHAPYAARHDQANDERHYEQTAMSSTVDGAAPSQLHSPFGRRISKAFRQ